MMNIPIAKRVARLPINDDLSNRVKGSTHLVALMLAVWISIVLYSGIRYRMILEESLLLAIVSGGLILGTHWLERRLHLAWTNYVIPLVIVAVNTAIYYLINPFMPHMEFIFALGVIGISVRWGVVPGLIAALVSLGGDAVVEANAFDPAPVSEIMMQGVFLALTALVIGLIARARENVLTQLKRTYESTLTALAAALDARDRETGGHSARVAALTLRLARQMSVTDSQLRFMHWGAIIHDVGKIGVSDAILRKPSALTDAEWVEMRRHPEIGYAMLEEIPFLRPALDVVRYHHERYDGAGYPVGLAGEQIPLAARIFAVVDAYDAMTSDRPYSKARTCQDALTEIRQLAGKQFDPRVVETFMRVLAVNK